MANTTKNPTRVITGPNTVFSYLSVTEPKAPLGGGAPKYSAQLIIPKSDTVTVAKIQAAMRSAYEQGQSRLQGGGRSVPDYDTLKKPLRDGDAEHPGNPTYAGCWFMNTSSGSRPGIVDADLNPILDSGELYSGIRGRASVNFYAFNVSGNRGIAAGLNNLQKLADGTPLGGRSRAEDDFADLEDEEDFLP